MYHDTNNIPITYKHWWKIKFPVTTKTLNYSITCSTQFLEVELKQRPMKSQMLFVISYLFW